MPFPIKQNEELKPFLKEELQFKMNVKNDTFYVELKRPKETAEGPQDENA